MLRDLGPRRLGREQNIDELFERRVGFFIYFFDLHRSDRMLHDQHRMIWRPERLLLGFCQSVEGVGNQRNRKAAALLNLDRVVDTPRRARASIAEPADNEISLRC